MRDGSPQLPVWFVAFVDYGRNLPWHWLTRRGFRHCFAFAYDPARDTWVYFDPALEAFVVRTLTKEEVNGLVDEIWRVGGKVLKVRAGTSSPRRPRLFANCVTVMLHLLGVRGSVVRPSGLYRLLLRQGAVPAFEKKHAAHDGREERRPPGIAG